MIYFIYFRQLADGLLYRPGWSPGMAGDTEQRVYDAGVESLSSRIDPASFIVMWWGLYAEVSHFFQSGRATGQFGDWPALRAGVKRVLTTVARIDSRRSEQQFPGNNDKDRQQGNGDFNILDADFIVGDDHSNPSIC